MRRRSTPWASPWRGIAHEVARRRRPAHSAGAASSSPEPPVHHSCTKSSYIHLMAAVDSASQSGTAALASASRRRGGAPIGASPADAGQPSISAHFVKWARDRIAAGEASPGRNRVDAGGRCGAHRRASALAAHLERMIARRRRPAPSKARQHAPRSMADTSNSSRARFRRDSGNAAGRACRAAHDASFIIAMPARPTKLAASGLINRRKRRSRFAGRRLYAARQWRGHRCSMLRRRAACRRYHHGRRNPLDD